MMLRASLDLFWHHVFWSPKRKNALTMTEWGPLFLTSNNAPYVPTFIRAADRALYHASNGWRHLAADLYPIPHINHDLKSDETLGTNDRATKYEIEAFLGAVVAITEENLIGVNSLKKYNRLGKSLALGPLLICELRAAADNFRALGFNSKWRSVRNSAYHLNPEMTDWGQCASIHKINDIHVVKLEGIHYVEGAPADLIELFTNSFKAFVDYVTDVRCLLTKFAFQHISMPQHNTFTGIFDPLGNMNVSLGPNGYQLRHFPQTASDFVGPLKAD